MRERHRIADRPIAANLHPPVSTIHRLCRIMLIIVGKRRRMGISKEMDDRVIERVVVLLEGKHIVRFPLDDRLGNRRLAPHRINRQDASFEHQQLEQGRQGGDFVRFLVHGDLSEHETVRARPGADHMDRRLARLAIMRTAHRLAIAGDHRALGHRDGGLHPGEGAGLEPVGVEGGEDPSEGVMGRNAVGQGEKGVEPLPLGLAELLHRHPLVGATDDRAQGDGEDVEELMLN